MVIRNLESGILKASLKCKVKRVKSLLLVVFLTVNLYLLAFTLHPLTFAQQPQAQAGQAIFPVNAKFVQGFGPGYWPTAGSNLTLDLAPGTAVCSNVVRTYPGGTLSLAPSATNYVYLNSSNNCAPGSNTTGFTTGNIPIATVVTTSTAISTITDVRTMFVSSGAPGSGSVTSVGMTGDGIIFSPTVSGSPITSSGTLAPQLLTQTANTVFSGPGSGPAATPTFRALASADLPTIAISGGGTGQTTASAAFNTLSPLSTEGDFLYYHSSANTRLGVGTNGQCLTSNGTDPLWGSCASGGVSSISGDGNLITNSSSTGAVTLTAGSFPSHYFWGNNTGSSATAAKSLIGTSDTSVNWYAAGGGSAQAQTVTLTPAATALTAGLTVRWKPTAANTGPGPTLAVNGLTATTITKCGTTALVANDLTTANIATAVYDGTEFQLLNPVAGACAGSSGVSSFTGDGSLLSNSGSTGVVTAIVATATANSFWGNNTASSAVPGYKSIGTSDTSTHWYAAGGGSAQAQTVTLTPAATALTAGLTVRWKPTAANTGPGPTLAVNGLTATTITKCGTAALVANDLTTANVATSVYDGTEFQLLNPMAAGCGGGGNLSTSGSPAQYQIGVFASGATVAGISPSATNGVPMISQGSSANPTFGTTAIAGGGTGQTTANAGFNALSPLTTEGDLLYYHSSANARLARGSNGQCLTSNGTDPVWGSCGTGSGSSTGLGNGTTVIDASLQAGTDFATKVNAAIAACSPGPCTFDLRGFTGSQTMSANIQFPANSDVIMGPMTINMASGTQFLLSNSVHIHGATSGVYTSLMKTNTTNDYTPVIYGTSGNSSGVEIDHIWIGPTTSAGPELRVTSVAASSGGNAVYTGTFPNCGSNACAGFEFGVWGFQGTFNEGYFTATASTTTTLTLNNGGATTETAPTNVPGGTFAVQSGGWGIAAPFMGSHLHDIFAESDLGIKLVDSGCGCYNDWENLNIWSGHGAIYLGVSTASLDARSIAAWAADDNNVGYSAASGYGVRALNGSSIRFDGLDIENTKYSIVLKTGGFQVDNLYLENDHTIGLGLAAEASLPILMQGSHAVKLPLGIDVVDLSNSGGASFGSNTYGSYAAGPVTQIPNPVYASLALTPISIGGYSGDATVGQGSGSTPTDYWAVAVDGNGNKTAPVAYNGVPLNQTLGPYTLTLTAASAASGGLTTYTGTITGGASGALNNNSFTISGFTNSGNNGAFSCPTSTSTTLVCTNSGGVAETHAGSAASDAYNIINAPFSYSAPGIKCYDILKGSTSQSLATCVPSYAFPLHDDGSITLQAYTAPTRNATGDFYTPGYAKLATPPTDGVTGICIDASNYLSTGCTVASATTATKLNGTSFAGTNGDLVSFGPSNTPADSGIVASKVTQTIASGAQAMGTSAIASGACASVVTVTAANVATTDVVAASFNGNPTALTGYVPSTSGMLTIIAYPTSGNVNFLVCNNTGASITPGAVTLNWRVTR